MGSAIAASLVADMDVSLTYESGSNAGQLLSTSGTPCSILRSVSTTSLYGGTCLCGRGLPFKEAERWTASVGAELQAVFESVERKLAQCQAKMAEKDEVIRRLHR